MMWLLINSVIAGPPNADVATFEIGTGNVRRLVTSEDLRLVAGVDGSGTAFILDLDTWSLETLSPCASRSAALPQKDLEAAGIVSELWIGCSNGSIYAYTWDGFTLDEAVDGAGTPISFSLGDVNVKSLVFDVPLDAIFATAQAGSDNTIEVHQIGFSSLALEDTIVVLAQTGFMDATISSPFDPAPKLYVGHGGDDISSLVLGSVGATLNFTQGIPVDVDAMTSSLNGVYVADTGNSRVVEYLPSSQQFNYLTTVTTEDPTALAVSWETDDSWLWVAGDTNEAWEMVDGIVTGERLVSYDSDGDIYDLVVGDWGYGLAGATDGTLRVHTDNPWLEDVSATPAKAVNGEVVTVSFSVNEDADWTVEIGGSRANRGTEIASGSASAGAVQTVEVTVDGTFSEGDNPVFLFATDNQGNEGHGRASISVDNVPSQVALGIGNIGYGNQSLILSFQGVEDEDLDHYDLYITTEPFEGTDYPTGGPAFGGTEITNPIRVDGVPGGSVSTTVTGLSNDTTYYIGVRAVDTGGQEGPMSDVVAGAPRETFSASDLAGETGGGGCSPSEGCNASGVGATWLAALGVLGFLRRRRGGAIVSAALLALFVASTAEAAKPTKPLLARKPFVGVDSTKTFGNFELRYGAYTLTDTDLDKVYGNTGSRILRMEYGPQLFRMVELDFGIGFMQNLAYTIDEQGNQSSERSMLTWYPLTLDLTFRPQIFDEQPVVPFVRYGWDYVLWNEKWDVPTKSSKEKLSGAKQGTHFGVGGNLLLDMFAPRRASGLETYTGINDTYITVEWRKSTFKATEGFDFSGTSFTVGLKLDY